MDKRIQNIVVGQKPGADVDAEHGTEHKAAYFGHGAEIKYGDTKEGNAEYHHEHAGVDNGHVAIKEFSLYIGLAAKARRRQILEGVVFADSHVEGESLSGIVLGQGDEMVHLADELLLVIHHATEGVYVCLVQIDIQCGVPASEEDHREIKIFSLGKRFGNGYHVPAKEPSVPNLIKLGKFNVINSSSVYAGGPSVLQHINRIIFLEGQANDAQYDDGPGYQCGHYD